MPHVAIEIEGSQEGYRGHVEVGFPTCRREIVRAQTFAEVIEGIREAYYKFNPDERPQPGSLRLVDGDGEQTGNTQAAEAARRGPGRPPKNPAA
jgi:hypothetical protein